MTERAHVVVLGSRGAAGQMHINIYRQLGVTVTGIDVADGPIDEITRRDIPWGEIIVDVCTPTGDHVASIAWAYGKGSRRFIVEKPAAATSASWHALLLQVPLARIFVMHPYLFSEGLRRARDAISDVAEIETVFDKDRGADDARSRGSDVLGSLPHVLQIEAPHQFAMLLSISPALEIDNVRCRCQGRRGTQLAAPLDCVVTMSDPAIRLATLRTDLRAERNRTLTLTSSCGTSLAIHFPVTPALMTYVTRHTGNDAVEVLFAERDDILKSTLARALEAMRSGTIPFEASTEFASLVLARIDEAIAHLECRPGEAANDRPEMTPVPSDAVVSRMVRDTSSGVRMPGE